MEQYAADHDILNQHLSAEVMLEQPSSRI